MRTEVDKLVLELQGQLLELSDVELAARLRLVLRLHRAGVIELGDWPHTFVREAPGHVARFGSFKGGQRAKALEIAAEAISDLAAAGKLAEWPGP